MTEFSGVLKFDISNPANPEWTEIVNLPYVAAQLRIGEDGYLYSGLSHAVIAILEPGE